MDLPTAAVADACVRLKVPVHAAALVPLIPGVRIAGPAVVARHAGSVDVFFEAVRGASPGSILVIDNGGRQDEGCAGDLTALEARHHGIQAMVVWGCHRDSADLRAMGMPTWSFGAFPAGPQEVRAQAKDALAQAQVGDRFARRGDFVYADDDGVCFVPAARRADVEALAREIVSTERNQAALARGGQSLGQQFDFEGFLQARHAEPNLTFRTHLRRRGGAIEE